MEVYCTIYNNSLKIVKNSAFTWDIGQEKSAHKVQCALALLENDILNWSHPSLSILVTSRWRSQEYILLYVFWVLLLILIRKQFCRLPCCFAVAGHIESAIRAHLTQMVYRMVDRFIINCSKHELGTEQYVMHHIQEPACLHLNKYEILTIWEHWSIFH